MNVIFYILFLLGLGFMKIVLYTWYLYRINDLNKLGLGIEVGISFYVTRYIGKKTQTQFTYKKTHLIQSTF